MGLKKIFCWGIIFWCTSCVFQGGSDTETGGVQGQILDTSGQPVSGVEVKLFKVDFNPTPDNLESEITMTNDSGWYFFQNLNRLQLYNLVGKRNADTTFVFKANLSPGGDASVLHLDLPVRLELTITYVDYIYTSNDSTHAYFQGTNIFTYCDSFTVIDTLPVGVVNLTVNNILGEAGNSTLPNNNGDWNGVPFASGGDTIRVDVQKYLNQPYTMTVIP